MVQKHARRIVRNVPSNSVFFECDIQEKMRKHIFRFDTVAHNAKRLTQFSRLFPTNIPIIASR